MRATSRPAGVVVAMMGFGLILGDLPAVPTDAPSSSARSGNMGAAAPVPMP
jgi:hypothetical protein